MKVKFIILYELYLVHDLSLTSYKKKQIILTFLHLFSFIKEKNKTY